MLVFHFGRSATRLRSTFGLCVLARMGCTDASGRTGPHFPGKVELHVHLDGSIRPATLLDAARMRGMDIGARNLEEFSKLFCYDKKEEHSLIRFLSKFYFFLPIIRGDLPVLERIAYEFCEDQARQAAIYTEARFSPHLLATSVTWDEFQEHGYVSKEKRLADEKRPETSPSDVVKTICRGLKRGSEAHGITVKAILCCMTHRPELSMEVVDLADKFRSDGVVGIDLAGNEVALPMDRHKEAFLRAKELGIHRTAHAGEVGIAKNMQTAIETLHAERIGHGYACISDSGVYDCVKRKRTHLEACIYSSYVTGALKSLELDQHPIKTWCQDKVNCSLSTDDPTIMQCSLEEEYERARLQENLTRDDLVTMCFNAARSAFIPEVEKRALVVKLNVIHGTSIEY